MHSYENQDVRPGGLTEMKILSLMIGIGILALICLPALANDKSDLISYYREHPVSAYDSSSSVSYDQMIQNKPSEISSKFLPTAQVTVLPFPKWVDSSIFTPVSKPTIPSSPVVKPGIRSGYVTCPPFIPVGKLHRIMVYCSCLNETVGCDCVNPDTGEHYPLATDDMGTKYLVKEGCPASWA